MRELKNIDIGSSILAVGHDGEKRVWTRVDEEEWRKTGNSHYFNIDEVERWCYDWVRMVPVGPLNVPGKSDSVEEPDNG